MTERIRPPPICLRRSMQKLGAVMGLGIERSVVGDILLDETGPMYLL